MNKTLDRRPVSRGSAIAAMLKSAIAVGLMSVFGLGVPLPASAQAQPDCAKWGGQTRTSQYVTMRDGTRLAVDIVLPIKPQCAGTPQRRFPVIFRYTPYSRAGLNVPLGDLPAGQRVNLFVAQGYALVFADMRGTGASDGWMNQMSPQVRADGKALVDWIATQPWSTGKVGMNGGSYEGWSQLAIASMKPKALKVIVPMNPGWQSVVNRPGGVMSYAFIQTWSTLTYNLNRGRMMPGIPLMPSRPVIDEDGDGELADEIPVDLDGNSWFYDDYSWPIESGREPVYADGVKRKRHEYLRTILQHVADKRGAPGSYDGFELTRKLRFRDERRPGDGLTVPDTNWAFVPDIAKSGVAILFTAGWFDPFIRSVLELQATLAPTNPTGLIATPAYHQGISPGFAAAVGWPADRTMILETLRWYDYYLKGIGEKPDGATGVKFFMMNAGWRQAASQAAFDTAATRLYLSPDNTLSGQRWTGGSAADSYKADFRHHSTWGPATDTKAEAEVNARFGRAAPVSPEFERSRAYMYGMPSGVPDRTELDKRAKTYTTTPLSEDMDVIGFPIVHLWASSTADDGDFHFYLEDVGPDGKATLVSEYQMRAGFSRLRDNDTMIPQNPGITVLPKLPWHGFARKDYDPHVFRNGRVAEVVSALYPTAWRFRKGHSIRLSVAAADWPTFELHPALSPTNHPDAPGNIVPTLKFHYGTDYASYVELPVAPARGGK